MFSGATKTNDVDIKETLQQSKNWKTRIQLWVHKPLPTPAGYRKAPFDTQTTTRSGCWCFHFLMGRKNWERCPQILVHSALPGADQLIDPRIKGRCRELLQPAIHAGRMRLPERLSGQGVQVLSSGSLEPTGTKQVRLRGIWAGQLTASATVGWVANWRLGQQAEAEGIRNIGV